jgi:hypothetical protein
LVQWLYSNAIGGVKLEVDDSDLELARDVLSRDASAELTGVREGRLPPVDGDTCPACGSVRVDRSHLWRNSAAVSLGMLSLGIGLPVIAARRRWVCGDCGHSWKLASRASTGTPVETLEAERSVQERRSYSALRGYALGLLGLAVLCYLEYRIRKG